MLIEKEDIETRELERLVRQEVLALQIHHFIEPNIAEKLSEKILGGGYENYLNAPTIGRIGMAFYEAENQPARLKSYFDTATNHIEELRRRCFPYLSPVDLLRCKLDEVWPAGAHIETLHGNKMFVGLSRVMKPNVPILAHHDILSKDAPDSFHAHSLRSQLAANVYLLMPAEGGAIQIWNQEFSPDKFDEIRGDSYGIEPALLGDPDVVVHPKPGDLILFNSRLMHAVTPGTENIRLSLSCFMGYRGPAMPLTFWS